MRIGHLELTNNLILAPMAGVTDRPFRQLCRRLGAGMAVSEMVSSNAKLRRHRITLRRLDFAGEPGPVAVQIVGSDPAAMAAAARANADIGADIIDINMGCPAKKVCKVDAGSALLRSETLVAEILAAVVAAVDIPVTLKIRTGWSRETRNGERIARIAEQEGIRALAVHGRTRACGFSGDAEYDTIRTIKQSVRLPVIANGDIDCPEKALLVLRSTGADALMIGEPRRAGPGYSARSRIISKPGNCFYLRRLNRWANCCANICRTFTASMAESRGCASPVNTLPGTANVTRRALHSYRRSLQPTRPTNNFC